MDSNYIGSPLNFRRIEGQEFNSRNTFDLNGTQNDEMLRLYLRSAGLSDEIECLNVEQRRAFIYDIIRSNKLPGYWLPSTYKNTKNATMQRPSVRPPPPPPQKFAGASNQPLTTAPSAVPTNYRNTDFGSIRSNASNSSLHSLETASPILPQRFIPAPTTPPSPSTMITSAKGITYEISAPTNFQHTSGDMTRDRSRNAFDLTGSSNDNVLRKYMMERGITEEDVAGMRKADIIRKIVQSKFTWMNDVWKYYDKIFDSNVVIAKCKNEDCGKLICVPNGAITPLKLHLKICQSIDLDETGNKRQNGAEDGVDATKNQNLEQEDEGDKMSGAERIVRLLTDGVSISCLITSQPIREMCKHLGQELPTSGNAVIEILRELYQDSKTKMKQRIQEIYKKGIRFSYTADEWASLRGKRYLHIKLHGGGESFNLGLIRIVESLDAAIMKTRMEEHFLSFGIDISKFIVGFTSDGGKAMKQLAVVSGLEYNFCVLQIIHAAVMDFFYKQNLHESKSEAESELKQVNEKANDFDDVDNFDACFLIEKSNDDADITANMRADINESLQKMRNIIKYFGKSVPINSLLESNIKVACGRELELLLDCDGRWNTIPGMIQRFLICKQAIIDTLQALNMQQYFLKGMNFEFLKELADALELLRLATLHLEKTNTTVAEAEIVIELLLNKLKNMNCELANELGELIKFHYNVGRNRQLVSLVRYLQNPGILKERHTCLYSSKIVIHNYAKYIMRRLFPTRYNMDSAENAQEDDVFYANAAREQEKSFLVELNEKLLLEKKKKPHLSNSFQRELNLFDSIGAISENIKLLRNALNTMQASSTEVERTFTISGKFTTKIMSSLSYETLNMLVFLKEFINK